MHILITAGPTREYIDPVRFISNAGSGKMGYAVAQAAVDSGHTVTLISGPTHLPEPKNMTVEHIETTQELFKTVQQYFQQCDCLVMTASVADYTPAYPSCSKLKKTGDNLILELKATPDILKWAGHNKTTQQLVGFALEDMNILENAEKKMAEKNLDMIVANQPEAIGSDTSSVSIKIKNRTWQHFNNISKTETAKEIIRSIETASVNRADC